MPWCNANGQEVLVKTEGWVASSSPTTSPRALGVQFRALTLAGEASLTFPSCSSCPLEEGFCLLLSDCHTDAYLLRSLLWIASEPAAFGSYHWGVKGVSFDNNQYPSEACVLQSVNKKQRLCTAKPSSWVRKINKTTQILSSAPSLVFHTDKRQNQCLVKKHVPNSLTHPQGPSKIPCGSQCLCSHSFLDT